MAPHSKLKFVFRHPRRRQKISTLLSDPRKVFWKYVHILENKAAYRFPRIDSLVFKLSKERLYRFMKREKDLDDILCTAFNCDVGYWSYRSIRPGQIPSEIKQLAKEVKDLSPRIAMEIGTAKGGTLYIWSRYLESCQTIISIDLPRGPFGAGYPKTKIKFFKLFAPDKELYFLRGDSHSEKIANRVSQILKSDKLDFLFIDGDHTYEGVKRDFEMYSKLVRLGGIIAFHDIVPGPPESVGGVPRFWDEIKFDSKYIEIVKDWKQGGYGIGVIYI